MIIDGKRTAASVNEITKSQVQTIGALYGVTPSLAVVLVGSDPASQVYVRNKVLQAKASGITSIEHHLSADTSTEQLLDVVAALNADRAVSGILVQLPLPKQIDEAQVISAISAEKDVDGFHEVNSGRLLNGDKRALVPCTPQGCVILAKQALGNDLSGKHAVVVGRSNIVGKPLAVLMLQENCSVSIVHSRTPDIEEICRQADILFVAVGRPLLVKANWVKEGATVIDVGINRIDLPDNRSKLVGDVDFEQVVDKAAYITPVPGGVGPMTIACLLRNTVIAACNQHGFNYLELPQSV
jgi:methylenetetrahydrofolate dehydrogenase (NADP+) / methenyltetrahydrofolate cyclohydrolase